MTVKFYFDEHMPRSAAKGLTERGCEVVMAVDVGMVRKNDDHQHLPYATENHLVMVTFDREFVGRSMSRTDHAGLICISEKFRTDIGGIIRLLLQFSEENAEASISGQVFWLK
jgi:predicted nuclease of predicted toxin-antitoxin system